MLRSPETERAEGALPSMQGEVFAGQGPPRAMNDCDRILLFVMDWHAAHGSIPSITKIMRGLGLSSPGIKGE